MSTQYGSSKMGLLIILVKLGRFKITINGKICVGGGAAIVDDYMGIKLVITKFYTWMSGEGVRNKDEISKDYISKDEFVLG